MKPSHTQKGCPVPTGQTKGIRGDPPPVVFASCAYGGCSQRMPWWGWPFGPGAHARSHAWQVLLALHGCTGKEAHWKVSPMSCFQSQTAKSPPWKHCGHTPSRAGPPWLPVSGTWEGPGRECSSSHRSFHLVSQGICHQDPNCPNDCQNPMGQVHCPLWVTHKSLMDQGWNFKSQLVADLCELMWARKVQTSPYHLQTNCQCERFNSTLINMLGALPKEKKSEWKNYIGTLVHAYNCTWNSATAFSPYFLMFERQPHLPSDVILGLAPCTITEPNMSRFVQKITGCTWWAQKKAEAFQAKEAQQHKWNYDKWGRAVALEVGDTVLVHVTTFKVTTKYKIDGKIGSMLWKSGPIPMYQSMWYTPGMGKGTAGPYIGIICFLSALTYSRVRWTSLW